MQQNKIKGINFDKSKNPWLVRRTIQGKQVTIGRKKTREEAIRLLAAHELAIAEGFDGSDMVAYRQAVKQYELELLLQKPNHQPLVSPGRPRKLSDDDRLDIIYQKSQGISNSTLAKIYGVDRSMIFRLCQSFDNDVKT